MPNFHRVVITGIGAVTPILEALASVISRPESLKACFAAITPNWEKRSHLLDSLASIKFSD